MIKKKLGRKVEVVGRAEAFLVAEELDELGVELGGGAMRSGFRKTLSFV